MPNATRPHKTNKWVRQCTLYINTGGDDTNLGSVKATKISADKEIIEVLSNTTAAPYQRLEFLEPPIIEVTTLDINWTALGEICGLSVDDVGAGTEDLPTDIGFTVYTGKVASVNGGGYTGLTDLVLNTAADGAGDTLDVNDDYVYDAVNGTVIATGDGAITDEDTVYVESGKYTTVTSKRVNLLATLIDTEALFKVVHVTTDSKTFTFNMWKGNITSPLDLTFVTKGDVMGLPLIIKALDDTTNHATSPFGYLDITA